MGDSITGVSLIVLKGLRKLLLHENWSKSYDVEESLLARANNECCSLSDQLLFWSNASKRFSDKRARENVPLVFYIKPVVNISCERFAKIVIDLEFSLERRTNVKGIDHC
ncbi:hypothetical protein CDAR_92731 [Caerostris darwini]|uniref:Uncharacterized protein n=1 Tax=Caerostris darwini TaxID=1538125 RepID=A0AAV4TME1_9ARAC|nr:hypothetical protein CDAR_92731 [Caerostris darwini]